MAFDITLRDGGGGTFDVSLSDPVVVTPLSWSPEYEYGPAVRRRGAPPSWQTLGAEPPVVAEDPLRWQGSQQPPPLRRRAVPMFPASVDGVPAFVHPRWLTSYADRVWPRPRVWDTPASRYPFPAATDAAPLGSWGARGTQDLQHTLSRKLVPVGEHRWIYPAPTDAAPLLSWQGRGMDAPPAPRKLGPLPTLVWQSWEFPLATDTLGWRVILPSWVGGKGRRRPPSYQKLAAALVIAELVPLRWLGTGPSWLPARKSAAQSPWGQWPPFPPAAPQLDLYPQPVVEYPYLLRKGPQEGWSRYPFPTPVVVVAPDLTPPNYPGFIPPRVRLVEAGGERFLAESLIPVPGLVTWRPTFPERAWRGELHRGQHPWITRQPVDPIANPPAPELAWAPELPSRVWGRVLHPQLPRVWTSTITLPPPPDDRIFPASSALPPAARRGVGAAAPSISFAGDPPPAPLLSWKGTSPDWIRRRAFPLLPFEVDAAATSQILIAQQLAWRGDGPAILFRPVSWDHRGAVVEVITPLTVADGYGCVVLGLSEATFSQILQVACGSLLLLTVQSSTITNLAVCT